jgi:two-component system NtrC family sensor kinase
MLGLFRKTIRSRQKSKIAAIQLVRLFRSISIENWLRWSFITLIVSNLAIVGTISIQLNRDAHYIHLQELQEERALALAREVRIRLDDFQQQLSYLQKVRGLAALPKEIQRALLEGLTRENDAYETIAIVSEQGEILTAIAPYSTEKAEDIALNLIQRTAITTAIHQKNRYIHPVELHENLNVPVTIFVLPLQDRDGRSQGVLMAMINLDFLNSIVARSQIGKTGYVYIIDEQSRVIARKRTAEEAYRELDLEIPRNRDLVQTFKTNLVNSVNIYQGLRNIKVLGTSSFIYGVNWRVIVELPLGEVYTEVYHLMGLMIIIVLIAIAISIVLSLKIAQLLIAPLEYLTQVAHQISHGEFSTRVKIKQHNEWGVLASAFNSMTAKIRRSFKALEIKNNELSNTLQELKQTQLQLIQTEKMSGLGQLVAGIAHEINNPINFINGNLVHTEEYAKSLLKLIFLYQQYYPDPDREIQEELEETDINFLREDFPKLLRSMQVGSQRVREIVTSLRNFSRLDESNFKKVDIHEGIENTLVILQSQIKAKSNHSEIKIVKEYGNLPLVPCYPARLNQVFMNLINNAIHALARFRQKGSDRQPEIAIATECTTESSEKNAEIVIRIADNGEGIPDEVKQRIFDPFFTTKPIGEGTGLGLSISYQIVVETHQGTLECFSTKGKGTVFQIKIPCYFKTVKNPRS